MTSIQTQTTKQQGPRPGKPKTRLQAFKRAIRYRKNIRRIEYGIFRLVIGGLGLLGLERASNFGGWLLRTIGPRLGNSNRARRALRKAFPEKTEAEIETIVRGVWDSVGRTAAEYAHLKEFHTFRDDSRVEIEGIEIVEEIERRGKGGIYFSGHFANWELMPIAMMHRGQKGATVYRPINNTHINDWMVALRGTICPTQISKNNNGARDLMRRLREKYFVAMLTDQKIQEGIPVPFFGRDALTTPTPARLALKFDCPLIPAWIERVGPARYKLHVYPPLEVEPSGDLRTDIYALMVKMNAFLEERIRERPEQWLWLHNRWGEVKAKPKN